jgi:hypothetical protein
LAAGMCRKRKKAKRPVMARTPLNSAQGLDEG